MDKRILVLFSVLLMLSISVYAKSEDQNKSQSGPKWFISQEEAKEYGDELKDYGNDDLQWIEEQKNWVMERIQEHKEMAVQGNLTRNQLESVSRVSERMREHEMVIYADADCIVPVKPIRTVRFGEYKLMLAKMGIEDIQEIGRSGCVYSVSDRNSLQGLITSLRSRLRLKVQEDMAEKGFAKRGRFDDVIPELADEQMSEVEDSPEFVEIQDENPDVISPYQTYVTPYDPLILGVDCDSELSCYRWIFDNMVWLSDSTGWGVPEMWIRPTVILNLTDRMESNPVQGQYADDCSGHAVLLTSMLRAKGVKKENVRYCIGLVNFSGSIGGHAWVELDDGDGFFVLETSSGDYFDDELNRVVRQNGFDFDYFRYNEYPVVNRYFCANDMYFQNYVTGESNAPWDDAEYSSIESIMASKLTTEPSFITKLVDALMGILDWLGIR
jgi:hypothetical protein